jgi:transcriptional regulator with XRE-family HTH domain
MDRNWKLLAEYAARRRAELGLSQIEVAQRGPLSLDRVQSIEGAKRKSYRLGTLLALERALNWGAGSVEAILAGGEPNTHTPPRSAMDVAEEIMDENEEMVQEVAERFRRLNRKKRMAYLQLLKTEDDPSSDSRQG